MILTFGHSTMTLEEARRVLDDEGVGLLVDIRSHPTSNHGPQWKLENIVEVIPRYSWEPSLGGWSEDIVKTIEDADRLNIEKHGVDIGAYTGGFFPKNRIGRKRQLAPGEEGWSNWGLYDFSWFMTLPVFHQGILRLKALEEQYGTIAIMCAEYLWWACHRSLVADCLCYLYPSNPVIHLQPRFTNHLPHARRRLPRYEQEIRDVWGNWL